MFIHRSHNFLIINLDRYLIDQDIEVCAIQLDILFRKIIILTIYRSPSGKFENIIAHLDLILHTLHHPKVDFILRGNLNIDYLKDIDIVRKVNALLETHNLINTVTSPTRIGENSGTAIDNIFLDISKHDNYKLQPLHSRLH
jgi:hypothetical protein